MTANDVLVIAWLVLAHLVADFFLQTEAIATDKFASGARAWRALAAHVALVALALLPVALAFGTHGLAALGAIAILHGVIDRTKITWTNRVEAAAMEEAALMHEAPRPAASLGSAWTPVPAALFVLDQVAHGVVIAWAWAVFLRGAPLEPGWIDAVSRTVGGLGPAEFHRAVLIAVVAISLAIVNVRAGSLFVATLVNPREVLLGDEPAAEQLDGDRLGDDAQARGTSSAYTLRIGPFVARAEPTPSAPKAPIPTSSPGSISLASPARVGEAIGVLERLLIVAFVLTANQPAIGFVVAAKTLARFRQLDDRRFAEYYLLGTLASVSVALASGLLALAALSA